jgi:hypothetical protein
VVSDEQKMKAVNDQTLDRKPAPLTAGNRRANRSTFQDVLDSKPPRAGAAKRKSGPPPKRRGRLDREVLAKLGKGLKDCFADVQNKEVPERFRILLRQF